MGETLNYETSYRHTKLIMIKAESDIPLPPKPFPPSAFSMSLKGNSLFPIAQAKFSELSLNVPSVSVSLSYPTSNSSANSVSSAFKIYPESDHFL